MPNINDLLLKKFEKSIARLAEVVNQYSHIKIDKPCFDPQLFKDAPSRTHYSYYLSEINNNYQKLTNLINKNTDGHYLEQISYLSELMVNQIEALQRELSTINLRNKVQASSNESESLYEKYNKNLEYLRRLEAMRYELEQPNRLNDSSLQQQISVLNQRIVRCKQAIVELELQIEVT